MRFLDWIFWQLPMMQLNFFHFFVFPTKPKLKRGNDTNDMNECSSRRWMPAERVPLQQRQHLHSRTMGLWRATGLQFRRWWIQLHSMQGRRIPLWKRESMSAKEVEMWRIARLRRWLRWTRLPIQSRYAGVKIKSLPCFLSLFDWFSNGRGSMNETFIFLFVFNSLQRETTECGDGQFRCGDGLSCIPLRRVCDGSNHCRDNSDETNCSSIGTRRSFHLLSNS